MVGLFSALLAPLSLPALLLLLLLGATAALEVRVCTSKSCSRQGAAKTLRTLRLLEHGSAFSVVSDGSCAGNCGSGPNIWNGHSKGAPRVYGESNFDDVIMLSAVLQVEGNEPESSEVLEAVMKLVHVLQEADRSANVDPSELDPVVSALTGTPFKYALAEALLCRSELHAAVSPVASLRDAEAAVMVNPLHPRGYMMLSAAQETKGMLESAVSSLVSWAESNPQFRTKAENEIRRIQGCENYKYSG